MAGSRRGLLVFAIATAGSIVLGVNLSRNGGMFSSAGEQSEAVAIGSPRDVVGSAFDALMDFVEGSSGATAASDVHESARAVEEELLELNGDVTPSLRNGSKADDPEGGNGEETDAEQANIPAAPGADVLAPEDLGNGTLAAKTQARSGALRVALFNGEGMSRRSWQNVKAVLECPDLDPPLKVTLTDDLMNVTREEFDVLIIPGGIANKVRNHYRKRSYSLKSAVKKFIKNGGGYVGICAGAYLAGFLQINAFSASFVSLGVGYFTGTSWLAKTNEVPLAVPNKLLKRQRIFYSYGPLFRTPKPESSRSHHIRNPRILLRVNTGGKLQIHKTPEGVKHESSTKYASQGLVVSSDFAAGRVVLSTTHQETDVTRSSSARMSIGGPSKCGSVQARILQNMIYFSAHRDATSTTSGKTRPWGSSSSQPAQP